MIHYPQYSKVKYSKHLQTLRDLRSPEIVQLSFTAQFPSPQAIVCAPHDHASDRGIFENHPPIGPGIADISSEKFGLDLLVPPAPCCVVSGKNV